jgi:hypothetical protein
MGSWVYKNEGRSTRVRTKEEWFMARKKKPGGGKKKTTRQPAAAPGSPSGGGRRIYTLDVFILEGPMSDEFMDENEEVSRTIEIRGDQTLEDLHEAIFDAFDRFDQHMYEFQIGGKRPMDPKARRYVVAEAFEDDFGGGAPAGEASDTTLDSLGLKVGDAFAYWFDFGDDWWHQINVEAIEEKAPTGQYPRVTKQVGKSPPQYEGLDEEDEEDEDEDE